MDNEHQLTPADAYDIADSFAQASARILDFRVENRSSLSIDEASELEKCEDRLDQMVVQFRGNGIKLLGASVENAVLELKSAISVGKKAITEINKIKKGIKVAGALVELAAAVLAQDPEGVISAAKGVKTATNDEEK